MTQPQERDEFGLPPLPLSAPMTGHNNPPVEDALALRTDQLVDGADAWAKGVDEIRDEDTAKRAVDFLEQLIRHSESLEAERTTLAKPLRDQLQAIQDRFNPMKQKVAACITIIKGRLNPWLDKVRKRNEEAAAAAKAKADQLALEAQQQLEASRGHRGPGAVAAIVSAENAQQAAKVAATTAKQAAKKRPQARGDFAPRALSQRIVWSARIVNREEALLFLQEETEILEALQTVANRLAREKKADLMVPGLEAVSSTTL